MIHNEQLKEIKNGKKTTRKQHESDMENDTERK